LREIQALRKLTPHPNIIHLEEVLYDEPTGRLAMVFDLMDANLFDLISGRRDHLDAELVRKIGYQMFTSLQYMHGKSIFHRDIKVCFFSSVCHKIIPKPIKIFFSSFSAKCNFHHHCVCHLNTAGKHPY